jgi:hypothetical protein
LLSNVSNILIDTVPSNDWSLEFQVNFVSLSLRQVDGHGLSKTGKLYRSNEIFAFAWNSGSVRMQWTIEAARTHGRPRPKEYHCLCCDSILELDRNGFVASETPQEGWFA